MSFEGCWLTARLATVLLIGALAGCAHNDVLVFGTDTKLALDIETGVAQGESPSITIGYKRKEAVWMPLIVNGADTRLKPCAAKNGVCVDTPPPLPMDDLKYKSTLTGYRADGTKISEQTDAYSVFASLGATVKGNASATNPSAGAAVGIAQFFATGNAAVNITRNEALVTALKIDSAGAEAQANAVAAATGGDPTVTAAAKAVLDEANQAVDCLSRKGSEKVIAQVKTQYPTEPDADGLATEDRMKLLRGNRRLLSRTTEACKAI